MPLIMVKRLLNFLLFSPVQLFVFLHAFALGYITLYQPLQTDLYKHTLSWETGRRLERVRLLKEMDG